MGITKPLSKYQGSFVTLDLGNITLKYFRIFIIFKKNSKYFSNQKLISSLDLWKIDRSSPSCVATVEIFSINVKSEIRKVGWNNTKFIKKVHAEKDKNRKKRCHAKLILM